MLDSIKDNIRMNLNHEVKIISKENRNRNEIFYGYITECYSRIFIVDNGIDKKSYSYSDILSKDISVTYLT